MWKCSACELKFMNIQDAMKHAMTLKKEPKAKKETGHFVSREEYGP